MMDRILAALAVFICLVLGTGAALAQTPGLGTNVDLSPLLDLVGNYAVELVALLLVYLYGLAPSSFIRKWFGEQTDREAREGLDRIARMGIRLALQKLRPNGGPLEVDAQKQIVAIAANYVIQSAPGWVSQFNLTPERVRDMVAARLGDETLVIPPVQAPASPTVAPPLAVP